MANTLANSEWVTKEVARGFTNNLGFLKHVSKTYDDQYKINGAKVGRTVNARLPQRFQAADGEALQPSNLFDQTVPITLTNQKQVSMAWSSAQATTELDSIRERYTRPAAETLANAADVHAYGAVYKDVYQNVGTPGTTPSTLLTYLQAGVKLTDAAVTTSRRWAILDPMAMATIANTGSTMFNSAASDNALKNGSFSGKLLGLDGWDIDPNNPKHTTGTFTASTPVVNGASQTGTSLVTSGWASGATSLKKGDTFRISGVYSINPLSYASTGRLQDFVVGADATDTTGAITLTISPGIITSGQLATVDSSPANNASILYSGATSATGGTLATTVSPQSMIFHPDAFAFVMADLVQPTAGAESTVVRSKALGLSIRMVEQYQIGSDQNPTRLDILIGAATVQARLAARVWG